MNTREWHRSRNIGEAFSFALGGLRYIFTRERNVRIQTFIGTLVVCAMFFLRVPFSHMAILILAMLFVITLEMINTSIELLSNIMHPEYSEMIRIAKDLSSGAVLLASAGACIVGILILVPAISNF